MVNEHPLSAKYIFNLEFFVWNTSLYVKKWEEKLAPSQLKRTPTCNLGRLNQIQNYGLNQIQNYGLLTRQGI